MLVYDNIWFLRPFAYHNCSYSSLKKLFVFHIVIYTFPICASFYFPYMCFLLLPSYVLPFFQFILQSCVTTFLHPQVWNLWFIVVNVTFAFLFSLICCSKKEIIFLFILYYWLCSLICFGKWIGNLFFVLLGKIVLIYHDIYSLPTKDLQLRGIIPLLTLFFLSS